MSQTTVIDDRDLDSIAYTGSWVAGGTANEHAGTVTSSMAVGDSFEVTFTGSSIAVLGTYDASSKGVQTSYSIDGGKAEVVTNPGGAESFQKPFWSSGTIPQGPHKLKVTMVKVNPTTQPFQGTVWFDLFNVVSTPKAAPSSPPPTPSPSSISSAPPSSTKSEPTKSIQTSAGISSTPSASQSAAAAAKGPNVAPIVGGVIAALLVLLALVAVFLFYRRRRRTAHLLSPNSEKPTFGSLPPSLPPAKPNQPINYPFNPTAPWASGSPAPHMSGGPGGYQMLPPIGAGAGAGVPPPGPSYPVHMTYNPYAGLGQTPPPGNAGFVPPPPGAQNPYYPPSPQPGFAATSVSTSAAASSIGRLFIANDDETDASSSYYPPSTQSKPKIDYSDDSVAALKRRQQQVVDSYNQGLAGGSADPDAPVVQHTDSGIRDVAKKPIELPPVYSAT